MCSTKVTSPSTPAGPGGFGSAFMSTAGRVPGMNRLLLHSSFSGKQSANLKVTPPSTPGENYRTNTLKSRLFGDVAEGVHPDALRRIGAIVEDLSGPIL